MNYLDNYLLFSRTEKKLSESSIESYRFDLNEFVVFVSKNLIDVSKEDVMSYINSIRNNFSVGSINRHISSIRGFYNYLLDENVITLNPFENVSALKTDKRLPKYLSISEVDKLLSFPLITHYD